MRARIGGRRSLEVVGVGRRTGGGTGRRVFSDVAGNRSRSWCSMPVCGDTTKTRAYRAGKRGSRHLQGSNTDTV
ncbi:CGNR zinc finger domain-containing protein [Nonomuraea sp. NPDC001636]|uniref:CGNR zinc finger domain-containing protein n=1 Tax=Nonomuraea sp. NPDC001636 TaxID=3154391 RepID=UPI00332C9F37